MEHWARLALMCSPRDQLFARCTLLCWLGLLKGLVGLGLLKAACGHK